MKKSASWKETLKSLSPRFYYLKECFFTFKKKFYLETDDCFVGQPLPITLSEIYMKWAKKDAVQAVKKIFYKRCVNSVISVKIKHWYVISNKSNNHHTKIKLTIERNSKRGLDKESLNLHV